MFSTNMARANHILTTIIYISIHVSTDKKMSKKYSTSSLLILILLFRILFLKRLVAWFFQTKLNRNSAKLSNLKAEKKKVIEKVMDKETYKVRVATLISLKM